MAAEGEELPEVTDSLVLSQAAVRAFCDKCIDNGFLRDRLNDETKLLLLRIAMNMFMAIYNDITPDVDGHLKVAFDCIPGAISVEFMQDIKNDLQMFAKATTNHRNGGYPKVTATIWEWLVKQNEKNKKHWYNFLLAGIVNHAVAILCADGAPLTKDALNDFIVHLYGIHIRKPTRELRDRVMAVYPYSLPLPRISIVTICCMANRSDNLFTELPPELVQRIVSL